MRPTPWEDAEKYRLILDKAHMYYSEYGENFGAFVIHKIGGNLKIIVSAGTEEMPWEHASVSLGDRCPTWSEMCRVKRLFWLPTETVIQLHVPDENHINCHPFTLHLWRPIKQMIPLPPPIMV